MKVRCHIDGYVLIRNSDGRYVAPPGMDKSYVDRLEEARVFPTRAAAERERCVDSESVAPLTDLLRRCRYCRGDERASSCECV